MKDTRPWTSDELRLIRTCATTHSVAQVAAMLGRNRNTVMAQARRIGVSYAKYGDAHVSAKYPADLVRMAVDAHVAGESVKSISERLGVLYITVYKWCTMSSRWRDVLSTETAGGKTAPAAYYLNLVK